MARPDDGVVGVMDASCRAHGAENLHAVGTSVFCTGAGYANPTLTAVALALRLADHLNRQQQP